MFASSKLDDRFLDRPGCGDELYLDSRFRASVWLESLTGHQAIDATGFEIDFADDDYDDITSH